MRIKDSDLASHPLIWITQKTELVYSSEKISVALLLLGPKRDG